MTEEMLYVLYSVITSGVIGYQIFRVSRAWRHVREEPAPPEVREKSHGVANEAAKVQAELRQIGKTADPFSEIINRLRGLTRRS